MKANKYTAFYRKEKNNWGIKNKLSKFEKNELIYSFNSKEQALNFITDLLESERKRWAKEFKEKSSNKEVRCEVVFLVLTNFRYS